MVGELDNGGSWADFKGGEATPQATAGASCLTLQSPAAGDRRTHLGELLPSTGKMGLSGGDLRALGILGESCVKFLRILRTKHWVT